MASRKRAARPKQFNVRLEPEEWRRLDRVSAHYGLPHSSTLRLLLKQEDDRLLTTPVSAGRALPKARAR